MRSSVSAVTAGAVRTSVTVGLPAVIVPVLSSRIVRQSAGLFERLAAAEEDAGFSAASAADHDGGRCRQAQRAGAGDHEDGNHVEDGARQCRVADGQPADERHSRQRDHGGHEVGGDPVGDGLDWRFAGLRVFDEADDLGEHGVATDALRFDDQPALLIDSPADDFGADGFIKRHALAREHGFVNGGAPLGDDGVNRDALAGLDQQQVARNDFINWNGLFFAIAQESGGFRRQSHQALNGGAGAAFGARFQQFAQRNQGENDGGRFEVVRFADQVSEVEEDAEQDDNAVAIGGERAHRHQHIHIGAAVAQGFQRAAEVLAAEQDDHRRRHRAEDEEPNVVHQGGEVVHEKGDLVQEVARHAEHGQRDGESGADDDEALLSVDFGLASGCFGIGGRFVGGSVDDAIAGAFY